MPVIQLQPAPACRNVVLRDEYLEESLGASFAADESAVGFGKGSGRQNQFRLLSRRIGQVIEDDQVRRGLQKHVDFGRGRAPVEIVFEDDHGVGAPIPDRFKRRAQGVSTQECRAHGIALGRRKAKRGLRRHRHIRGRFDDGLASATGARNHERLLGRLKCAGDLIGQRKISHRGRA